MKKGVSLSVSMSLLLVVMLISACGNMERKTVPTSNNLEQSKKELLLPASLLFLKQGQIWQLSCDTKTIVQITQEPVDITEFDLSTKNDRLVYISQNQLILSLMDGSQRKIIRSGHSLKPHSNLLDELNDLEQVKYSIRNPLFSEDGDKITFIENGLKQIDLNNSALEIIWENNEDHQNIIAELLSISPDGKNYLILKYSHPTTNIYQRSTGLLTRERLVTFYNSSVNGFSWSNEGQTLFLTNSKMGNQNSLMRCHLEDNTCAAIAEFEPARWYYFYAFPKVVNESRLSVFMATASDLWTVPDYFTLVQVNADGYGRQELYVEKFPLESALWEVEGKGVIIQISKPMESYLAGSVLWVDLVEKKTDLLPIQDTSQMKWGGEHDSGSK